ncbi:MAG TPA: Hsp20/alpha crystallin family protein [bacterium]|nr:MAG: Spore protein SP21 [Parcubacteria group bacterium ADurb.Bin192]HPN14915.1 Hsp20/alpha crystallin family protein [bacterium]
MSSIIKWAPFFEPFENFDEFFKDAPMALTSKGGLVPPVDMYETKDSVIVETTLPGADPKKVSVEIENGVLTIKGSCERKTEVDEKNYYRREIRSGQVFRQITLPKRIEDDKAEAGFENGILRVTIPKSPEAKAKAVKIDVKNTD